MTLILQAQPQQRDGLAVSARPGPLVLDGMIAAAAEMALADGSAEPEERRGLLTFLRQNNILAVLGRRETDDRFAAALDQAQARRAGGQQSIATLADVLGPIAGMQAARLVVRAAAHVAAADGTLHPKELALLRWLHSTLGLTRAGQPA
jgi:tellurite resistance protein TerB